MEAPDAAEIAENAYFLCSVMHHDKVSSVSPYKGAAQKNQHTQKILKMYVSPLFLNLL